MKLPGIGEVKPTYVWIGGGVVGGIVLYAYAKRRAAKNAAAADTSSADSSTTDNSIDPTTGLPYADEGGVYGYGAIDPSTGVPYQYESGTTNATTSANTITTNQEWLGQAEQDAQEIFGATYTLASGALGKFLAQTPGGLNDSEYLVVSEVLAELGQPPVGGPYRLIHAPSTPTGGGGGITGGQPPSGGGGGTTTPPTGGGTVSPPVPAKSYVSVSVVRFANPAPWNSTISGIAQHYGYGGNWQAVWNDSRNAALRAKRGVPEKIQPGDIVWVLPK